MSERITAIELKNGKTVQHIVAYYVNYVRRTKSEYIKDLRQNPRDVFVGQTKTKVRIVEAKIPYLKSNSNNTTQDNLLSLPNK